MLAVNITVSIFVAFFFVEVFLRFISRDFYSLALFNFELFLTGLALMYCYYKFRKLARELFPDEFNQEENYFRFNLLLFIIMIGVRVTVLIVNEIFFDGYVRLW